MREKEHTKTTSSWTYPTAIFKIHSINHRLPLFCNRCHYQLTDCAHQSLLLAQVLLIRIADSLEFPFKGPTGPQARSYCCFLVGSSLCPDAERMNIYEFSETYHRKCLKQSLCLSLKTEVGRVFKYQKNMGSFVKTPFCFC